MITSPDRSMCGAKRHGTEAAYRHHHCRCADAREEARVFYKRVRERRHVSTKVDAIGTQRRIRALIAIGHTQATLGAELGVTADAISGTARWKGQITKATEKRYRELYDRLSMVPGKSTPAREYAQRHGWAPPLAWDDDTIDDPAAKPYTPANVEADQEPDHAVVLRAVAGERGLAKRPADRFAVASRMRAVGVDDAVTAEVLNVQVDSVRTLLRRHRQTAQEAA